MLGLLTMSSTSFVLGFLHGFDTDHLVEVTDFVSQDSNPRRAIKFGLKFAFGHTFTVLIFGLIALVLKTSISENLASSFEVFSGILLIILGIWSIQRRFFRKQNRSIHCHSHTHIVNDKTELDQKIFKYGPIITGIVTGLAGTAGILLFGPIVASKSLWGVTGFILIYGLGVLTAMCCYGLLASKLFGIGENSEKIRKMASFVTGVISIILGVVWISRAYVGLLAILNVA